MLSNDINVTLILNLHARQKIYGKVILSLSSDYFNQKGIRHEEGSLSLHGQLL